LTGPITVLGLLQGGCYLEDIRTTVPHRMSIQIPPHLAERSQSLVEALHRRQVMRLGSSTSVVKETPVQLNTSLRGRGIAPPQGASTVRLETPAPAAADERELLALELEATRAECRRLQALNDALQAAVSTMTEQLGQIRQAIETLAQRAPVAGLPLPAPRAMRGDAGVSHYIPATTLEAAEVRITPSEATVTSNVDHAVAALRSLRGKSA